MRRIDVSGYVAICHLRYKEIRLSGAVTFLATENRSQHPEIYQTEQLKTMDWCTAINLCSIAGYFAGSTKLIIQ